MSLWGVHIGVAGITTVLVLFFLAPGYRYRGFAIAGSCLWAVLPDFHHALGAFPGLQTTWKATLHNSELTNLFWFHQWFDQADPRDRVLYSLAVWAALFVVIVATELVIRRRREQSTWE